jgi:hypothetical protein
VEPGRVDDMPGPEPDAGDRDDAGEAGCGLVVSGGHMASVLELPEAALDVVALRLIGSVDARAGLWMAAHGNDGDRIAGFGPVANAVGVGALVEAVMVCPAPRWHRRAEVGRRRSRSRAVMSNMATGGLDPAKDVFRLHGIDGAGRAVPWRKLRCGEVLAFIGRLPTCGVATEGCGGAPFRGRGMTSG